MERKVLVALDNSEYYREMVAYLAALFADQPEVSLHLLGVAPCPCDDAGRDWLDQQELLTIIDETTRKGFVKRKQHMHQARETFLHRGFDPARVSAEVRLCRVGIAADILHQARQGEYDVLAMGKRDITLLEKMIAGSVSTEVLDKHDDLPVWVLTGDIGSARFLVPVDCTPHTLDAVDHLAFILQDNPHAEITLFHSCALLAGEHITPREEFHGKWGEEWCDRHLRGEEDGHFHFAAAEQILREGGFPAARIHRLKSDRGIEPGQMIVHHVKHDGFGTIVMGRRRKDVGKGIFRGVSDRVLANVNNVAVWIVG